MGSSGEGWPSPAAAGLASMTRLEPVMQAAVWLFLQHICFQRWNEQASKSHNSAHNFSKNTQHNPGYQQLREELRKNTVAFIISKPEKSVCATAADSREVRWSQRCCFPLRVFLAFKYQCVWGRLVIRVEKSQRLRINLKLNKLALVKVLLKIVCVSVYVWNVCVMMCLQTRPEETRTERGLLWSTGLDKWSVQSTGPKSVFLNPPLHWMVGVGVWVCVCEKRAKDHTHWLTVSIFSSQIKLFTCSALLIVLSKISNYRKTLMMKIYSLSNKNNIIQ